MAEAAARDVSCSMTGGDRCHQDMEKLETLLQEMIVRKFGKQTWHFIIQRSLALCDFDQHIQSYGPQRVFLLEKIPPPEGGRIVASGSRLLDSAAEHLGTTIPCLLEQLGGHYAHSLRGNVSSRQPFTSQADYFTEAAYYYNACSWILDAVVPGSLQVTSGGDGRLEILCALREHDLGMFLKGFLAEMQGGLAAVLHSETITPQGGIIHSFVLPNRAALEPDCRAGDLALVG